MMPRTAYVKMIHAWRYLELRYYRLNEFGAMVWLDDNDRAARHLICLLAYRIEGTRHSAHKWCPKCPNAKAERAQRKTS